MGRRKYYSRRNMNINNGDIVFFVKLFFYIVFLPFVLIYYLIKLIVKLSKKKKLTLQEDESLQEDDLQYKSAHISFYSEEDETSSEKTNFQQRDQTTYQQKNSLITDYERYFYNILEETFGNEYKIQTQVNLASIVKKVDNSKYQNELFRNVDFGIFEKSTLKPLLMIEINDSTHKKGNRYKRDLNVRKILEESNIKLITFYSNYPNKRDYVVDRIVKELYDK